MLSSSRVIVELSWYHTSIFLVLILRPNVFDVSEKASTIVCISSPECATSALSSANSSSLSHQYPSSLGLRSEVCDIEYVSARSGLYVHAIPHVSESIVEQC